MSTRHVIIVAGGSSSRFSGEGPKQFSLIHGLPMLAHTMRVFATPALQFNMVVVVPKDHLSLWSDLCRQYHIDIAHNVVAGGATRFHSVSNGLRTLGSGGTVLVHDGARPCVSQSLVERVVSEADTGKCVVPAVMVDESLRKRDEQSSHPVDRSLYVTVQTPQGFPLEMLQRAYALPYREQFTDCATVVEAAGETITLVEGEPENLKVTWPGDLEMAALRLGHREGY